MTKQTLYNTNVASERVLIAPADLKRHLPNSEKGEESVWQGRGVIRDILKRKDHRLLVITGPCSIHDLDAAREYALKLKALHDEQRIPAARVSEAIKKYDIDPTKPNPVFA